MIIYSPFRGNQQEIFSSIGKIREGSKLNSDLSKKQNSLGFTPVQQGGGTKQGTNKIYIGWDGTFLRAQVDKSDFGGLAFKSDIDALKKSVVDGKQKLLDGVNRYWNASGSGWTAENTSWGNFYDMYQIVYESGKNAGASGGTKVKSGTVTGSQNATNQWTTISIATGLSSVSGGMATVTGTYGSPNGYVYYSSSGGTLVVRGVGFDGNITINWIAYGS